jgi:hypothetical protein
MAAASWDLRAWECTNGTGTDKHANRLSARKSPMCLRLSGSGENAGSMERSAGDYIQKRPETVTLVIMPLLPARVPDNTGERPELAHVC